MPSTSDSQRACSSAQASQPTNISPPIRANAPPVDPPPPYQLIDPASSVSRPTSSLLLPPALSANLPVPVPLPGAPLPNLSGAPLQKPTTSSSLPLIPGPPMPGQGPKAGRRRPKQDGQQKKTADQTKTGKNKGPVFGPSR